MFEKGENLHGFFDHMLGSRHDFGFSGETRQSMPCIRVVPLYRHGMLFTYNMLVFR